MTIPKDVSAPLPEAASKSSDLTKQAGGLIGKSALVATHAALTLARGAVASADNAVRKYLPAGTAPAGVARKAKKKGGAKVKKAPKAAGKAKRVAKLAVKSRKQRTAKRGRRVAGPSR